jgi:hypothetical protein
LEAKMPDNEGAGEAGYRPTVSPNSRRSRRPPDRPRPPAPTPEPEPTPGASIVVRPNSVYDARIGELPVEFAALDDPDLAGSGLPTISEVGKVLPIGYRDQTGEKHASFDLVEWNWDVEEALGDLVERNQEMSMGTYISEVIGTGLRVLGGIDFTKLTRAQRRLVVSNMYQADALYVYVWIRIAALGPTIRFDDSLRCDRCRRAQDFVGDLRTLEVKVHEGEDVPTAAVELDRPFPYGKGEARKLVVGPLRWSFMETDDVTVLTNPAKFRLRTLRNAVVGVEGAPEGAPVVLTREHARAIGPAGVNRIVAAVDEIGGGAVMECVGRCVSCGQEFRRAIDWTYDNFFGRSSR